MGEFKFTGNFKFTDEFEVTYKQSHLQIRWIWKRAVSVSDLDLFLGT